jgi:hypothetical protein
VIQSSSATDVIGGGFVISGIMRLEQAISVIMAPTWEPRLPPDLKPYGTRAKAFGSPCSRRIPLRPCRGVGIIFYITSRNGNDRIPARFSLAFPY